MGVTVEIEVGELRRVLRSLADFDPQDALVDIGELIEMQVRHRIDEEKTAPDGTEWPAWSPRYAATRGSQHSLLIDTGSMLDSIEYQVGRGSVTVSAFTVYAATHQYGDDKRGIPARPFLGLSDENIEEIGDVLRSAFADAVLR